jgi:hypothetical protein
VHASRTSGAGALVCNFSDDTLRAGTCVVCGHPNAPICPTGEHCRGERLTEFDERCVPCGKVGQPKCLGQNPKCRNSAPDPVRDLCVAAGGKDQPCFEGRLCGYDGMFCDASNTCRVCGWAGQVCCPPQALLGGGQAEACLTSGMECKFGHCVWKPGAYGDAITTPPPAPPPPPPTICNGQPFNLGVTERRIIWIREEDGCAAPLNELIYANSYAEGVECARRSRDNVLDDVPGTFHLKVQAPDGCRGFTVRTKDEDDAQSCAEALCGVDCESAELGDCEG